MQHSMGGIAFEVEVQDRFRSLGWRVEQTPVTGDYGADLVARLAGEIVVVQCKDYGSPAGVRAVQEVHFAKAKVALVVGATPENIMLAGSAVKDAPHHASVPGFVYTGFPGRGHIWRQTDLHMSICGSQ